MDLEHENSSIMTNRIKTGITGFDELIDGGIPQGSFVVVTGGPGTGKTILASQFLANGVMKYDEKGLFISVEQPSEDIVAQAKQFGWDFDKWENEGKIKIISLDSRKLFELKIIDEIKAMIEENHYDRVVIDSITSFVYSSLTPHSIADGVDRGFQPSTYIEMSRANAVTFIDLVKRHGITAFGIAQKIEGMPGETIDHVSEFKADGLFVLNSTAIGKNLNRTIQVKKLRKTRVDAIPHNFDFESGGICLR